MNFVLYSCCRSTRVQSIILYRMIINSIIRNWPRGVRPPLATRAASPLSAAFGHWQQNVHSPPTNSHTFSYNLQLDDRLYKPGFFILLYIQTQLCHIALNNNKYTHALAVGCVVLYTSKIYWMLFSPLHGLGLACRLLQLQNTLYVATYVCTWRAMNDERTYCIVYYISCELSFSSRSSSNAFENKRRRICGRMLSTRYLYWCVTTCCLLNMSY